MQNSQHFYDGVDSYLYSLVHYSGGGHSNNINYPQPFNRLNQNQYNNEQVAYRQNEYVWNNRYYNEEPFARQHFPNPYYNAYQTNRNAARYSYNQNDYEWRLRNSQIPNRQKQRNVRKTNMKSNKKKNNANIVVPITNDNHTDVGKSISGLNPYLHKTTNIEINNKSNNPTMTTNSNLITENNSLTNENNTNSFKMNTTSENLQGLVANNNEPVTSSDDIFQIDTQADFSNLEKNDLDLSASKSLQQMDSTTPATKLNSTNLNKSKTIIEEIISAVTNSEQGKVHNSTSNDNVLSSKIDTSSTKKKQRKRTNRRRRKKNTFQDNSQSLQTDTNECNSTTICLDSDSDDDEEVIEIPNSPVPTIDLVDSENESVLEKSSELTSNSKETFAVNTEATTDNVVHNLEENSADQCVVDNLELETLKTSIVTPNLINNYAKQNEIGNSSSTNNISEIQAVSTPTKNVESNIFATPTSKNKKRKNTRNKNKIKNSSHSSGMSTPDSKCSDDFLQSDIVDLKRKELISNQNISSELSENSIHKTLNNKAIVPKNLMPDIYETESSCSDFIENDNQNLLISFENALLNKIAVNTEVTTNNVVLNLEEHSVDNLELETLKTSIVTPTQNEIGNSSATKNISEIQNVSTPTKNVESNIFATPTSKNKKRKNARNKNKIKNSSHSSGMSTSDSKCSDDFLQSDIIDLKRKELISNKNISSEVSETSVHKTLNSKAMVPKNLMLDIYETESSCSDFIEKDNLNLLTSFENAFLNEKRNSKRSFEELDLVQFDNLITTPRSSVNNSTTLVCGEASRYLNQTTSVSFSANNSHKVIVTDSSKLKQSTHFEDTTSSSDESEMNEKTKKVSLKSDKNRISNIKPIASDINETNSSTVLLNNEEGGLADVNYEQFICQLENKIRKHDINLVRSSEKTCNSMSCSNISSDNLDKSNSKYSIKNKKYPIIDTDTIECYDSDIEVVSFNSPINPVISLSSDNDSDKESIISLNNVVSDNDDIRLNIEDTQLAYLKQVNTNHRVSKFKKQHNTSALPLNRTNISKEEERALNLKMRFHTYWTPDRESFYNSSWGGESYDHHEERCLMPDSSVEWANPIDKIRSSRNLLENIRCRNCRQRGHVKQNCSVPSKPCTMCGSRKHREYKCNQSCCLTCFSKHDRRVFTTNCKRCQNWRNMFCRNCQNKGHIADFCPDLWRRYHLTVKPGKLISPNEHLKRKSTPWCSICAQKGHLSETCRYYHNILYTPPDSMSVKNYSDLYEHEHGPPPKRIKLNTDDNYWDIHKVKFDRENDSFVEMNFIEDHRDCTKTASNSVRELTTNQVLDDSTSTIITIDNDEQSANQISHGVDGNNYDQFAAKNPTNSVLNTTDNCQPLSGQQISASKLIIADNCEQSVDKQKDTLSNAGLCVPTQEKFSLEIPLTKNGAKKLRSSSFMEDMSAKYNARIFIKKVNKLKVLHIEASVQNREELQNATNNILESKTESISREPISKSFSIFLRKLRNDYDLLEEVRQLKDPYGLYQEYTFLLSSNVSPNDIRVVQIVKKLNAFRCIHCTRKNKVAHKYLNILKQVCTSSNVIDTSRKRMSAIVAYKHVFKNTKDNFEEIINEFNSKQLPAIQKSTISSSNDTNEEMLKYVDKLILASNRTNRKFKTVLKRYKRVFTENKVIPAKIRKSLKHIGRYLNIPFRSS